MADNLPPSSADVMESGNLNLPEPSGPHRPVMGLLYVYPEGTWGNGSTFPLFSNIGIGTSEQLHALAALTNRKVHPLRFEYNSLMNAKFCFVDCASRYTDVMKPT
jgi:hypothetical protein